MIKRITFISFIVALCGIHCFAQGTGPNVTYLTSDTLTAGTEMTALKPTSAMDKSITYAIKPQPADGLKFDTAMGVISGKPGSASSTDYQITATKDKVPGIPFTIKIVVRQSSCNTCTTSDKSGSNTNGCKNNSNHQLSCGEWWLVFLPVMLFVILLVVFLIYVGLAGDDKKYNLGYALSENSYATVTKRNKLYDQTNLNQIINTQNINTSTANLPITALLPATITITDDKYRPSMSRLIAFLTSIMSLAVGMGLSSFFIYSYLKTGCEPDIGKLSSVLISMGIGVAPYAVNKVTGIFGSGQNSGTTQPTPGKTGA